MKIFGSRSIGRATLVFFHDLVMTGVSFVIALYLRVGVLIFDRFLDGVIFGVPACVLIGAVVYRRFGLYRGIWRFASLPDLVQVAKAVSITT
ncbi:MAG TPA: polysaccharide biosynthesis protein, partial [Azospirillaceae bacterium]|nr:polysaccharide biosynthesis protein [Azospirillaceae bacterium]